MHIRSILLILFLILLHNNIYSQEKPDTTAQTAINFKTLSLTRLVFTDSLYFICGYYDASNNILYDCNGKIILDKPDKIRNKIPDSLCCSLNDTDGDGVNDEIDKCINEKGPASNYGCPIIEAVVKVHLPLMPSVFFTTRSSHLSAASMKAIETTVKILKEYPDLCVNLDGHTDNLGNDELNRSLSLSRIKAVRYYLLSAGIDKKRITYAVYGSKYPIDDNRTKAGRSRNRRVEFYIYKKSDKKNLIY